MNTCYALAVLVRIHLCWYAVPSTWAESCEPDHNAVQRRLHESQLQSVLDPVQDSALLLHRETADPRVVIFAISLLKVHDLFKRTCHDHHWFEALTDKLCDVFVQEAEQLSSRCTEESDQRHGARHGPGSGARCICAGLESLLLSCRHHVLPWAHDDRFCDALRDSAWSDCEHAHPFSGLCRIKRPRYHTPADSSSKVTVPTHTSASLHSTTHKHTSWKKWRQRTDGVRWHEAMHERVRSGTHRSGRSRQHEKLLQRTDVSDEKRHSEPRIRAGSEETRFGLFAGVLVVRNRVAASKQIRDCASRSGTVNETTQRSRSPTGSVFRFCSASTSPALSNLVAALLPGCVTTLVDPTDATWVGQCDGLIGWMPLLLRLYHETPHGLPVFWDPGNKVTGLTPRNPATNTHAGNFEAAVDEYGREVEWTCARWGRLDHGVLQTVKHTQWFTCGDETSR